MTLWTTDGDAVRLKCVECAACGSVLFPPQHLGCEACGAPGAELEDTSIAAEGTLHSFTTVHLDAKRETPFLVGELVTEAVQLIRARIGSDTPTIGQRLVGHTVEIGERTELEFVTDGTTR